MNRGELIQKLLASAHEAIPMFELMGIFIVLTIAVIIWKKW
jgi:hypothetical protein